MLDRPVTQAEFAALVGVTQQRVADLQGRGILTPGGSCREWVAEYCAHLRASAAGRTDPPEVAAERAALVRAKREGAELELARRRGELVGAAAVRAEAARIARELHERAELIADRAAPRLGGASSREAAVILREEVRNFQAAVAHAVRARYGLPKNE